MRSLLLLLLLLPVVAAAQINRSAKELASEKIQEYIVHKLFKNGQYKPVAYGELKVVEDKVSNVAWTLDHKFEIAEQMTKSEKTGSVPKPYRFLFYLDEKMKVLRAETYYSN